MALPGVMAADQEHYVLLTGQHIGSRAVFNHPLTGKDVGTSILKDAWAAARLGKRIE